MTVVLTGVLAVVAAEASRAATADEPASDRVIVRFASDADARERAAVRDRADVETEERLPLPGMEVVEPSAGTTVRQAIAALERHDEVLYAEPDAWRRTAAVPNDPLLSEEWGLLNRGQAVAGRSGPAGVDIDAAQAWDVATGTRALPIAVVDSGIDANHPGLAPNVWNHPVESGGGRERNGVDDDGNGFVDDVRGWDFVQDDAQPADANGHGTHVTGTLAANGNDARGVTGVLWRASVIPLRVLGADGSGLVSDAVAAYRYAQRSGARIVNASLVGGSFSQAEYDAIASASNTLFVVAAGNSASDNDARGAYPCNHDLPNVVCVGALDRQDRLAGFSNFGARNVDLAAPGVDVTSTWPGGGWALMSGTSMATPLVAGVAALVLAYDPHATTAALRAKLLAGVRPVPALAGRVATGGRLNAAGALRAAGASVPEVLDAPPVAPAPAGVPAAQSRVRADRAAPTVRLRVRSTRLATVLRRGLTATVRCSEACTGRLELALRARAGRPGRASTRAARIVTSRGHVATARLRLTARTRAAVRTRGRVAVVLRASVADPTGNTRRVTRPLTLRR